MRKEKLWQLSFINKVASDLLVTTAPGKKKPPLKIRQDPKKGFYGETEIVVARRLADKKRKEIVSLSFIKE